MRSLVKVWVWILVLLLVGAFAIAGSAGKHAAVRTLEQAKKPTDFPREMELIRIQQKMRNGGALTMQEKDLYAQAQAAHPSHNARNPLDNQGGPDGFGYAYVDNQGGDTATYAWIELRGDTGVTWMNASDFPSPDDGMSTNPLEIGFNFPFYGNSYSQCNVGTNGDVQFTTSYPFEYTLCLPRAQSGAMLTAYATDLHLMNGGIPSGDGVIGYKNFGTYWVLEYDSVGYWSCPGASVKVETILYSTGQIKFQYSHVASQCNTNYPPNIGIQENGTTGTSLVYACGQAGIFPVDSLAIWYALPDGIPRPVTALAASVNGHAVTLTWTDPTQDTNGNPSTPDSLLVYRGAAVPDSEIAHVVHGVQTFVVLNENDGLKTYYVRAKHGAWLSAQENVSVFVGTPGYANNFETNDGGWVSDGLWTWGAPTNPTAPQPHSGTNCWGTGMDADYPNNACNHLDLNPQLDVLTPTATLEFWAWWSTYQFSSEDEINVKISVDEGQTWTLLTPQDGYGNTAPTFTTCIVNEGAWTMTSNGWRYIIIPLGDYAGQTPWFRFTFGAYSFTGGQYPGFFIDDLSMWGVGPRPNGVPQPVTNLQGSAGGTNTATFSWTDPAHDTNGNPLTPDSILFYRDNAQPGSQIGHVAGGVQTLSIPNQPDGNITYFVRAKAGTWISSFVRMNVLVGNPSYFSDFDGDNGDWVADNAVWQCGAPTNPQGPQPHSGTNVWASGLNGMYNNSICGHLDLSPGQAVSSPNATIEFWFWYSLEQGWDGTNVRVSVDEGNTWQMVHPNVDYPGTLNGQWLCGGMDSAWTGPTDGTHWQYAVIPLAQFIGQTPIFRFTMGSDGSVTYAGYFLDDVIIWGLAPRPDGQPLPVTNLQGTASGTTTVTLTWTDPNHDTNGNPLTPDSILIYRDASDSLHEIAHVAGGVQTIAIPNQTVGSVNYFVRAKHIGYTSNARMVNVMVGTPVYSQNFETDEGVWVATDGLWEWGAPSNPAAPAPHSGTNVWGTGLSADYPNSACNHLDLDLGLEVTSPTAVLDFWAWWSTYPFFAYDGCNVKASVDDGATWQTIAPRGGYDSFIQTFNTCLPGDSGWSLLSNGWRHVNIPIGQFLNQTPKLRFTFGSYTFTGAQYPGFFFDDMSIWGLHPAQQANISGHVALDGGSGDVTQALITANGLGGPTVHPITDGTFTLVGAQVGHRRLVTALAGYVNDTTTVLLDSTGFTGANITLHRVPPPAPANLHGVVQTVARKDSLHWDVSPDILVDGYKVYRRMQDSTAWNYRRTVTGRTTNFVKDTLEADGVYQYVVTAIDNDVLNPPIESTYSNVVTSPFGDLPPVSLTADGNYDNKIHLGWLAPGSPAETEVYYDNGIDTGFGLRWLGQVSWGYFVAHFQTAAGPTTISRIKIYFTGNATLDDPIEVALFADTGDGTPTFTPLGMISTTQQAPLNDFRIFNLDPPITFPSGSFFVGARQTTANGICIGDENTDPMINNTFYAASDIGFWSTFEANNLMAIPMIRAFATGNFGGLADERELSPSPAQARAPMRAYARASNFLASPSKTIRALKGEVNEMSAKPSTARTVVASCDAPGQHPGAWQLAERRRTSVGPHAPHMLASTLPITPASHHGRSGRTLDDVVRFLIYRDNAIRDSVAGTVLQYDDIVGTANENHAYSYYVKARWDDNQLSPASNTLTNVRCNMSPAAPGNFVLTPVGQSQMRLNWSDPTTNADGSPCVDLDSVRIYRDGTYLARVWHGVQQYTDIPPDPQQVYSWTVVAIDEVPNLSPAAGASGSVISPWHTVDYNWVDITGIGTPTAQGYDINSGPLDLGFPFEYYGNTYTTVNVCSNGWISFTDLNTLYWMLCPPDLGVPNNVIYGFGANLYPANGECKYYADAANQRFIVSWDNCPHYFNAPTPYNFQIILDVNGGITLNYGEMVDNAGMVGVENIDGSDGVDLWCNGSGPFTPGGNNAVQFWGGPRQAISGTVRHLGGSNPLLSNVWVRVGSDSVISDITGHYQLPLDPGTYTVRFRHATHCDSVRTNIVLQPNINTTLNVMLRAPAATRDVSSLTYVVHRNTTEDQTVTLADTGACPLHFQMVDSVTWLTSTPAVGDINPGTNQPITVRAQPGLLQPGEYQTNLWIVCNATGSPFLIHVDMEVLSVTDLGGALPTVFALHPNYPNPFNPTTLLPFDVPQQSQVDLVIFNVLGQEVARPVSGVYAAGRYQATFAGDNLPSGLYLVKMTAGNFTSMGKMMLLK